MMPPGVNPRQLKQMMKQMGMSQDDLDVTEVTIKTSDGNLLVFENPNVQKITMKGQVSFQLTGPFKTVEPKLEIKISEDDISIVMEQTNVSKEIAKKTLEEFNGDIAEAIIKLEQNN